MPDQVYCPACRRQQKPREEFGQLICPECEAMLPSGDSEAGSHEMPTGSGTSALDEAMSSPTRPTGAMTLLRRNLRTEEQDKQSGWLENILPRRPKAPANPEPPQSSRAPRESEVMRAVKRTSPEPHCEVPETAEELPVTAMINAVKASPSPTRPKSVPAHRQKSTAQNVSIAGALTVLGFGAISAVSLIPGQAVWASVLFLLTVALLGVSVVALWQRRQERQAFWQGFALFGCGYLVLTLVPLIQEQASLELPTSRLLRLAHATLAAPAGNPVASSPLSKTEPVALDQPSTTAIKPDQPRNLASGVPRVVNLKEFLIVGHCLFTMLAALIGSAIARWFNRSNLACS